MSIWVCQKHYDGICVTLGYEMPVFTIANVFHQKCYFCKDETIAIHYINLVKAEMEELKEKEDE
jgi:hypothetical protein